MMTEDEIVKAITEGLQGCSQRELSRRVKLAAGTIAAATGQPESYVEAQLEAIAKIKATFEHALQAEPAAKPDNICVTDFTCSTGEAAS